MLFSSGIFLVYFLPLVLGGYWIVPSKAKNAYLLAASLFFYWWGAPSFSIIVLLTSSANFLIARQLTDSPRKKLFLWLYILINLGLLCYFKYMNFFIENVNELLGFAGYTSIEWTKIVLPVGISFFTFQSITYGVDVYRKNAEPQKFILNYLLYILFFPQLIAGPIVTYRSIADQFSNRTHSLDNFMNGFMRFVIGLSKKVLIANVLAEYSDLLQTQDALYPPDSSLMAWLMALAYTFEIYFDFSGYSDMAIGLGRMFGFSFPENFDRPYLSKSITEFWRRWHMTLGDFMKNYLYIPLGGNRVAIGRMYANLLTVFTLSGLWHGASWNFLAWGLFHGLWLVIERLSPWRNSAKFGGLKMLFTFIIVLHGWVLFDATSMQEAINHLSAMYSFQNAEYLAEKNAFYFEIHLVIAALIALLGLSGRLNRIYFVQLSEVNSFGMKVGTAVILSVLFILCLSHVVVGSFNPFIYFQF